MKLLQVLMLFMGSLTIIRCTRPFSPTLCDAPDSITVKPSCYDSGKGLTMRASTIVTSDSSIRFEWTVFIFADSTGNQFFDHAQISLNGPHEVTVPDSLLKDNLKVYVRVNTSCSGKDKAPGLRYNQFVKRFKKATDCYQWEEQPF